MSVYQYIYYYVYSMIEKRVTFTIEPLCQVNVNDCTINFLTEYNASFTAMLYILCD